MGTGHVLASGCHGVGFNKVGQHCPLPQGPGQGRGKDSARGSVHRGKSPPRSKSQPRCFQESLDWSLCTSIGELERSCSPQGPSRSPTPLANSEEEGSPQVSGAEEGGPPK